uniref:BAR/IMD domain containing adaptor protein 2 like 2 n=1 Tax=Panthera tigris altaica TaxID=74533 RepID=A0A8C9M7K4_PANTA
MAPEMDQFYRSTMAIYKGIMEQFNPALENLVYLGNNYLRAFHALSEAAEVYFNAIQKIGEQALQSSTSQILGEILVQMSDTQRHLNSDLEVVVQTFHGDLLQHMEKNTKLDMQFIKVSLAAHLERHRASRGGAERKGERESQESVNRLHAQMQAFMSESQRAAELEEKRRYRFLAEKHLLLSNTFLHFFGRVSGGRDENKSYPSGDLSACSRLPPTASSRLPPPRLSQAPSPVSEPRDPPVLSRGGRRCPHSQPQAQGSAFSPCPSSLPRTGAPFQSSGLESGERSPGGDSMSYSGHSLSSKAWHTALPSNCPRKRSVGHGCWAFCLWDPLPPPRRSGWGPEAYVKPLEEVPVNPTNPLTPVTSMNLMNPMNELPSRYLGGRSRLGDWRPGDPPCFATGWLGGGPPPPPPRLPSLLSAWGGNLGPSHPDLSPRRGTNPFATVKLRPTVTNDRSAPLIR